MSGLLLSAAFEDHAIRVVGTPEAPCWVAQDVCDAIGIKSARQQLARFPSDAKGVAVCDTPGGSQEFLTVTEPGLYRLIFRSNKPEAERFRSWVFAEVLPAIRRTGSYVAPAAPEPEPALPQAPAGPAPLEQLAQLRAAGELARDLGAPPVELARIRELVLAIAYAVAGVDPKGRTSPLPGRELTVKDVALALGYRPTGHELHRIRMLAASLYKERHGRSPRRVQRIYGEERHEVSVYAPTDHDLAERAVRELLDRDVLPAIGGGR